MRKRQEWKEDGRYVIFYEFERDGRNGDTADGEAGERGASLSRSASESEAR